jgi:hypothetical protein
MKKKTTTTTKGWEMYHNSASFGSERIVEMTRAP